MGAEWEEEGQFDWRQIIAQVERCSGGQSQAMGTALSRVGANGHS